jgi:hypothetical protein
MPQTNPSCFLDILGNVVVVFPAGKDGGQKKAAMEAAATLKRKVVLIERWEERSKSQGPDCPPKVLYRFEAAAR